MVGQNLLVKGLLRALAVVVATGLGVGVASAQALLVERLSGGTELVLVAQPLADATTITWSSTRPDDDLDPEPLVTGRLTLVADLEAALGATVSGETPAWAPQVIVAVGGAGAAEMRAVLERLFGGLPVAAAVRPEPTFLAEGGLDRRLGAPGSDGLLRFEVALPPAGDWRRSSVEVLWELIPDLLSDNATTIQSRVDGDLGVVEARVDADLAELAVREIRLGLARIGADPTLQADAVADARRRVGVRRQAMLEEHPSGAELILQRWLGGGEASVRELLFGAGGVTLTSVREAAAAWLPFHPGRAQLILPPQSFNPRFAVGPESVRLGNDVAASVLERSGAPLAVVCLRPVVVPDLDGAMTATVLARVARELRTGENRPGWVRVRTNPPLLEVAGPVDGFGELVERLADAYRRVAADRSPVAAPEDDARRRALDLMAGMLGITESAELSPAVVLRPGNLVLGAVAADAEAAVDALQKFWVVESTGLRETEVHSLVGVQRTRAAAPGDESALVVALELPFAGDQARAVVVRELLEHRAGMLWPDARSRVFHPFVPGRTLLLFEIVSTGTIDEIEKLVRRKWTTLMAAVGEVELAPIKRRAAAASSAEMSGVAGHARLAAATAAGAASWRQPAEFELEILMQAAESVTAALAGLADWESLETTGAGVLPITEIKRR